MPLGATDEVNKANGGVFIGLDLKNFSFNDKLDYDEQHYSHSKQFRASIIEEQKYWQKVFEIITSKKN